MVIINVLKRFIFNYFLAIDQLVNTIMFGHPDETISSRLGRSIGRERYFWVGWFRIFVDFIMFFEQDHCKNSIMPLEQENFRIMADYEIWNWNK